MKKSVENFLQRQPLQRAELPPVKKNGGVQKKPTPPPLFTHRAKFQKRVFKKKVRFANFQKFKKLLAKLYTGKIFTQEIFMKRGDAMPKAKVGLKDLEGLLQNVDATTLALCREMLEDGKFLHKQNAALKKHIKLHGMVEIDTKADGRVVSKKSEHALQYNKNLAALNNITKTIYTIIKPREGTVAESDPIEDFLTEKLAGK